jgi:ketosteroid isomerase-like protein
MKSSCVYVAACFIAIVVLAFAGNAQRKQVRKDDDLEQTIKKLDLEAARAILERDEKGIARYFAVNSVTNDPRNGLTIGSAGVIEAARTGLIDYYTFERVVESVQVLGNTAITMGQETVTMKDPRGAAGAIYVRRYTNVWMRSGLVWQIVARHANLICR